MNQQDFATVGMAVKSILGSTAGSSEIRNVVYRWSCESQHNTDSLINEVITMAAGLYQADAFKIFRDQNVEAANNAVTCAIVAVAFNMNMVQYLSYEGQNKANSVMEHVRRVRQAGKSYIEQGNRTAQPSGWNAAPAAPSWDQPSRSVWDQPSRPQASATGWDAPSSSGFGSQFESQAPQRPAADNGMRGMDGWGSSTTQSVKQEPQFERLSSDHIDFGSNEDAWGMKASVPTPAAIDIPEPQPTIEEGYDMTTLDTAWLRNVQQEKGMIPGYKLTNTPMVFPLLKAHRVMELNEKNQLVDRVVEGRGTDMHSYKENRMLPMMANVQFHIEPVETVIEDHWDTVRTYEDYGTTSDWGSVLNGTSSIGGFTTLLGLSRESARKPLLVTRELDNFILTDDLCVSFMEGLLTNPTSVTFLERLRAYLITNHDCVPDKLKSLIAQRISDELRIRFNGSLGPLLEGSAGEIIPTLDEVTDLFAYFEDIAPGLIDKFNDYGDSIMRSIFHVSPMTEVDDDLLDLSSELELQDGQRVVTYRTECYDLYLPISSDEIDMELMVEWNAVERTNYPLFAAMLDELLKRAKKSARPIVRVIFTNGYVLKVDRSWLRNKPPIVKSMGVINSWDSNMGLY